MTVAFLAAAIAGLLYFYLNTERVDLTVRNRIIDDVNEIVLESTKWDTEIHRVNARLLNNYDDLTNTENIIQTLLEQLSVYPQTRTEVLRLDKTIQEKSNFVSQFKSEITVLKNALATLPNIYQKLLESDEIQQSEFDEQFLKLFTNVANYSLDSSPETLVDIKQQILVIENDLLNTDLDFKYQNLLYEFSNQTNAWRPNKGAKNAKAVKKMIAFEGVSYLGCNFANHVGNMPRIAIAYIMRLPPITNAFQLVTIPAIPPTTNT